MALALACGLAATGLAIAGAVGTGARERPAFADEFRAARLDGRTWTTCYWWAERGCTIGSNRELEWYQPGQVSVRDGVLRLTAERRSIRGSDGRQHPYVSGMISSGPRSDRGRAGFAFRYGRAEIRARFAPGRGLWPAFWLLPASRRSLPEVDVMEIIGQRPSTVEMHLHYRGAGGRERSRSRRFSAAAIASGWHRYAVDWRPGRLRWLVDGVERFRVTGAAVPSKPMYLIANLAVGGDWPGPPNASTHLPAALEIDWVRVWR